MPEPQSRSLLGVAARDLSRLRDISRAIASHGFGELMMRTSMGRRLLKDGGVTAADVTIGGAPAAVRFASLLGTLGPTFIKLGQILSMRHDLFSPEFIRAMEKLQDKAPVLPFATIKQVVEEGLGRPLEELYAEFDEKPLATASIAQTHLATTHEGTRVVVKVQRPGIEDIMRGDLDLLYLAAQVLESSIDEMQLANVSEVIAEFERGLLRELDFRTERANLLRMRENLDPARPVVVPRPFADLSGKTVLTMEFFQGKSVRKVVSGSPEATHVCTEIVHTCLRQVFLDGFFHGDPHAGNVLVDEQGVVCLIDLGMVGELSEQQRADIITLLIAAIANDSATIARVLMRMGTPTGRVDIAKLRSEIERVRAKYLMVDNLGEADTSGFVQEFADAATEFRIKLAPEYAILIKAAATVEGILRALDPKVDLLGIGRPYLEQVMARRFDPQRLLSSFAGELGGLATMARGLPAQIDQILHDAQAGHMQIHAVTPELDFLPTALHRATSRLALALFAATTTIAASLLVPTSSDQTGRMLTCILLGLGCSLPAWLTLLASHFVGRGRPIKLTPFVKLFRR